MTTPSLTGTTDFLNVLPKPQTDAQYEAIADALLQEMRRMNASMTANREQIQCINEETKLLKAETRSLLALLGAEA